VGITSILPVAPTSVRTVVVCRENSPNRQPLWACRLNRAVLALFALGCLFQPIARAQVKEVRRVLIFYELGLSSPGVELVDEGIRKALQNSPYQIELYREYLETTLFPASATQQEFRQWYIHKYRHLKPDLIIAAGPSPLRFMLDSHEKFFSGIPIVFCGTSQEQTEHPQLDSHFTGIWETFQVAKTLEVALLLQPGTKRAVVIGGTTAFDRQLTILVKKALRGYESRLDITYLTDFTMPQLLEKVKHLPPHTVVLMTDIAEDAAGTKFVGSTQAAPMVLSAANVPVFSLSDVDLGHGEVGGDLTSFAKEGVVVGGIVRRILKGEKPEDIPVVNGANVYMFDWRALQRWGFKETNLPPGSIILNRPLNFWALYWRYVLVGILVLLAQSVAILALLWQRARRREAELKLAIAFDAVQESERRFRLVANTAPVMIWTSGPDKRCDYFNKPWLDFTGRSFEQENGNGWAEGVHRDDFEKCWETYSKSFDEREAFQMEYRLRRSDGEYRWVFDQGVPRFHADGSFAGYIGSCIDVTERKAAEEALSNISRKLIEAHEEERTWIARELHDDFNQRITLLAVSLAGVKKDLPIRSVELHRTLEEAIEQVGELVRDIQALAHRLHSSKLEYLGLTAACAGFCRELSDRHKIEIAFHSEGIPKKLPQEIAVCLFRILQEALQNAVKYSGVRHFQVSLIGGLYEIELTIQDSGIGFDPREAIKGSGIGLTSMKERLKLVDGELLLDSQLRRGTTIQARVPLAAKAAAAKSCG
jgi:PAS domain S-box-containing protein